MHCFIDASRQAGICALHVKLSIQVEDMMYRVDYLGGQFGLQTRVDARRSSHQEIVGALLPLLICCILPLGAAIDRKFHLHLRRRRAVA
jgi:hypothetical protein